MRRSASLLTRVSLVALVTASGIAQETTAPVLRLDIPHSDNPIGAYRATLGT